MYKVSGNLNSAYGTPGGGCDESKKGCGVEMPHVTTGNRRMTNVKIGSGEYVQGIRRTEADPTMPRSDVPDLNTVPAARPLRYTPGLNCDAQLEALRPVRESNHAPFAAGDQWKKKLVPQPNTYEGSFVDADMQQFRPSPNVPMDADPWYTSRVPEPQYFPANERLMGAQYMAGVNPYEQIYPQDELSRIKMRNRRFQSSCGQEVMGGGGGGGLGYGMPMMAPPPMMYGGMMMPQQPMMMMGPMMPPQPQVGMRQGSMMPQQANPIPEMDDLQLLDQELNKTRRSTRPFVPEGVPEFSQLDRQRQSLEEPAPRVKVEIPTSIDQLPLPKKMPASGRPSEPPTAPGSKPKDEVRIADQIAIRSIVLGQSLSKMGGGETRRAAPPTPPPSMTEDE